MRVSGMRVQNIKTVNIIYIVYYRFTMFVLLSIG